MRREFAGDQKELKTSTNKNQVPFEKLTALTWKKTMKVARLALKFVLVGCKCYSRWWFQILFIFTTTWGNDPIWRAYFFKWVGSTTNQFSFFKGVGLPFDVFSTWHLLNLLEVTLHLFSKKRASNIHGCAFFWVWFLTFYPGKSAFLQNTIWGICLKLVPSTAESQIDVFQRLTGLDLRICFCWTSNLYSLIDGILGSSRKLGSMVSKWRIT